MSESKSKSKSSEARNKLREKLLSSHQGEVKALNVFGVDIELRQPSLGDILSVKDSATDEDRAAELVIQYAYVPGTDERIFEKADKANILNWPFGKDIQRLQRAVVELTGIDIEAAEKDLKADPSGG